MTKPVSHRVLLALALAFSCFISNQCVAEEPLKVFILAGQSNMVGHARAHTIATLLASDKPRDKELLEMVFGGGSEINAEILEEQLKRGRMIDEMTGGINADKLKSMEDGSEKKELEVEVEELKAAHEEYKKTVTDACNTSDRVYIYSIADRNHKSGKLGVGYGASNDKIGPEYGFGLSIAEKLDGPILLIKTSWGGKSLNYNFRPPSAGDYELNEKELLSDKVDEIKENAGLNYREMNAAIHEVLANLEEYHPDYDSQSGFEIAGFVWFQGFNDQFAPKFRDNYKSNMLAFISDIRKEYDAPNLPFVIGVLGTGVTAEKVAENAVSVAQREAASEMGAEKQVVSVESYLEYSQFSKQVFDKGWPEHYHEWDTVGSDRPYHYLGSGAFFVRLGDSFADAMYELMSQ